MSHGLRLQIGSLVLLPAILMTSGCGGRKVVATKPVELSIPEELAKAFEVKELPPAPATPPQPAAPPAAVKGKGKSPKIKTAQAVVDTSQGMPGPSLGGSGKASRFVIPIRRPEFDPIWVGEKVWMDVTWLNTKAGEFLLEVLPYKLLNGRKVYDLKGSARTSDLFSLIYKAEDWVQSYVDFDGWFPYKFLLHGDETKHIRDHIELFDHGSKKQYVHVYDYRIHKNEVHEEKGFKDLTPLSQDSISALYYVRTQKMEEGTVIRFPMTTNGSQWDTEVRVLGREEVSTRMGYRKAIKTKIETRFRGVLQQQGDAFIWFSDDERKFPIRFEAKVKIGWVAGIAKKIEPGEQMSATSSVSQPPLPKAPSTLFPMGKPDKVSATYKLPDGPPTAPFGLQPMDPAPSEPSPAPSKEEEKPKRKWFGDLIKSLRDRAPVKK